MINELIAYLESLRTQNALNRIVLLFPLLAIKLAKGMIVTPIVIGLPRWLSHGPARFKEGFQELLIHSIPNNLRCYNKIALTLFFTDLYCTLHAIRILYPSALYLYTPLKAVSLITPYMLFSPEERLPF